MKKIHNNVQKSIVLVHRLAAYRGEYLSIKQRSPRFERACQIIGITPETVRRHSPELAEKWYDSNYYWSPLSDNASAVGSEAEISSEDLAIHTIHSNKSQSALSQLTTRSY